MTFVPAVPLSGLAGLRFLERTGDAQQAALSQSPSIARDLNYFKEQIGSISTAEELVSDFRLMRVSLGAYGLDEDLGKTAFLRQILEDGTESEDAFANRLVDQRYRDFARDFGFGNTLGARTGLPSFQRETVARFEVRQFEIAVGNQDESLRLALAFKRDVASLSQGATDATWFSVLGNRPVRAVFDAAFGLPDSFATLDIDSQKETYQDRAARVTGSRDFAAFADADNVDAILSKFLLREQIDAGPTATTPGAGALTLLQGGTGFGNLLLSTL